jgi:hypothetical protein
VEDITEVVAVVEYAVIDVLLVEEITKVVAVVVYAVTEVVQVVV